MSVVLEQIFSAYLAFLPWFFLVVGLVLVLVGSAAGRPNRRVIIIGLWATGLSAVWLILNMIVLNA